MKVLIKNSAFVSQLNANQLCSLETFLLITRGGIAHKIRTTIKNNTDKYLSEEQIYGKCEKQLYNLIIDNAKEISKVKVLTFLILFQKTQQNY